MFQAEMERDAVGVSRRKTAVSVADQILGQGKRGTKCGDGGTNTFSLVARSSGGNVASSSLTALSTSEIVRV